MIFKPTDLEKLKSAGLLKLDPVETWIKTFENLFGSSEQVTQVFCHTPTICIVAVKGSGIAVIRHGKTIDLTWFDELESAASRKSLNVSERKALRSQLACYTNLDLAWPTNPLTRFTNLSKKK